MRRAVLDFWSRTAPLLSLLLLNACASPSTAPLLTASTPPHARCVEQSLGRKCKREDSSLLTASKRAGSKGRRSFWFLFFSFTAAARRLFWDKHFVPLSRGFYTLSGLCREQTSFLRSTVLSKVTQLEQYQSRPVPSPSKLALAESRTRRLSDPI